MKRNHIRILSACVLVFAAFLWGCGGGSSGPGSPGSDGSEKTGVKLDASITPMYLGGNTYSVDVFQDICEEGPPPEYEEFTDHNAQLMINARLVNPDSTFQAGTLYIEKYTVKYKRSNDSLGAPPILTDTRFTSIVITPPTAGSEGAITTETTVIFVDLLRKEQYGDNVLTGQYYSGLAYINNYTAIYTFEGQNEFGDDFSFQAQVDFQIGWFDYC